MGSIFCLPEPAHIDAGSASGVAPRNAHHGPASPTLSSIGLAPNQCRAGRVLMPEFLAILQRRDVADLPTV
jgi:hypothetical protein